MKLLLIIDQQRDFADTNGALYVGGGELLTPIINGLLKSTDFNFKIATRDWHPQNHISFASNHPGKKPFDQIETTAGCQVLWPDHCVAGTEGASLYKLEEKYIDAVFNKGIGPGVENYSIFSLADGTQTPFVGFVKSLNPAEIYICGLALDFCVKFTALDAKKYFSNARITVIRNATKPVMSDNENTVIKELEATGIVIK